MVASREEAFNKVMDKARKQKQVIKDRAFEKEQGTSQNKIIIERAATGLYYCRYSVSGRVPDELQGMFTEKRRILDKASRRGIEIEDVTT